MKTLTTKTRVVLFAALVAIITLHSCKKENTTPSGNNNNTPKPAPSVNNFILVNQGLIDGMSAYISSNKNSFKYQSAEQAFGSCGSVIIDTSKQPFTKIWDFGSGCTGSDGHYRAGQIVITYNSTNYRIAGDTATLSFNGYTLDSVAYAGGMSLTSYTDGSGYLNFAQNINVTATLDAVNYPMTGSLNWQWIQGMSTGVDVQFSTTGSFSGYDKNRNTQVITITNPLLKNFATPNCNYFVQGDVQVVTSGSSTETLDFGNGSSCSGAYTEVVGTDTTTLYQK